MRSRPIGFHEQRANELLVHDGKFSGLVAEPILGRAAKLEALMELTTRLGLDMATRWRSATAPTTST